MSNRVLKIEGMTCGHCSMRVEKALKGVAGVSSVQVDLARKEAVIAGSAEESALARAITEAGYKVTG
jgi:copper chaperone